jgi:hypothetical protein
MKTFLEHTRDPARIPAMQSNADKTESNSGDHQIGKVEITNSDTGETRSFNGLTDMRFSSYAWTEGDYGCDCNRALLFDRAAGEEGDFDLPCQHGDPTYRVRIFATDGTLVFDDTKIGEDPFVIAGHAPFTF